MNHVLHSAPRPRVRHLLGKLVAWIGWSLLCVLAYCVCQGMFGGYPQVDSFLLTTIGMVLISALGAFAWIRDEIRQLRDDHD